MLRFASTHTISILFFPDWFHTIENVPENMGLSLQPNHMDTCARDLVEGQCHFMLCFTNLDANLGFNLDLYQSKVIGRDHLVPISLADESGEPRHNLDHPNKTKLKILIYSKSSALGQMMDVMLARKPGTQHLKRHFESPLAAALKSMVQEDLRIAWIPRMRLLKGMSIRDLAYAGDESWWIPVEVRVFKAADQLPSAAEKFWNLIQEIN